MVSRNNLVSLGFGAAALLAIPANVWLKSSDHPLPDAVKSARAAIYQAIGSKPAPQSVPQ